MQPLKEIGEFRAEVYAYGAKEGSKTSSIALHIDCLVRQRMNVETKQFEDVQGTLTVSGDFWYIRATGEEHIQTVEMLQQVLGWDGTINSLTGVDENFVALPEEKRWKPNPIIITVKQEEYKGEQQYKIQYIKPDGLTRSAVPESAARRLAAKHKAARDKANGIATPETPAVDDGGIPF